MTLPSHVRPSATDKTSNGSHVTSDRTITRRDTNSSTTPHRWLTLPAPGTGSDGPLLLPGRRPVSNKTFQMWSRWDVRRKVTWLG